MADSRRLLLELIDDLLVVAREAASETGSLGRLVANLSHVNLGKAQSAAVYLVERGFSGHAYRLKQDVERLRRKADETFRGPFVAQPTPDDQKQERRCLGTLHSEAHGLLQFLNELKSLVDEDDDAVAATEQVKAIVGACLAAPATTPDQKTAAANKPKRSTKPADKQSKRGRNVDPLTVQRADFAKPLRKKGQKWEGIATAYRKKHPTDIDASADTIRLAYRRQQEDEPK